MLIAVAIVIQMVVFSFKIREKELHVSGIILGHDIAIFSHNFQWNHSDNRQMGEKIALNQILFFFPSILLSLNFTLRQFYFTSI